ncbi:MAG: hypothetical protein WD206_00635 [Actinomycetota bacterium]
MTSRARLTLSAIVVVAIALGGAALSGSISPVARRPLLDGIGPVIPYRWVQPPPLLRNTNRLPTPERFRLPLGPEGSVADVLATKDLQTTLVASKALIPPRAGAGDAEVTIEPLDPARFGPVPDGFVAAGNVVRIQARFLPGPPLSRFGDGTASVILVYPQLPTIHGEGHVVLFSPDGTAWERLETRDAPELSQAESALARPGYLLVGGRPKPAPSPAGSGSGSSTLLIVIGVGALSALLVGAGILLRLRAER